MGTRADFYIGRGEKAEWLGSIAYDGYPDGQVSMKAFAKVKTVKAMRALVASVKARANDFTDPSQGWPWPWEDSQTTDYAYAFDKGKVWGSGFGGKWFDAGKPEPENEDGSDKSALFPNMKSKQNVTLGPRSGLFIVTAR